MATGQVSAGYVIGAQSKVRHNYPGLNSPVKKATRKKMKLTLKQRFRSWLNDDDDQYVNIPQTVEESKLHSDGIRLQIYKASGGFVVETRGYDSKTDRSRCDMHVITDDQDLGEQLGKIVMMEALR